MRIWRGVMAGLVGGAIAAGAMSVAHGAEMLRKIARFWASAATDNPELDRYEIRGVMGPDEYHDAYPGAARPGLNNNAYTSAMAAWVLWRTVEVLDLMPDDERRLLRERLGVTGAEVAEWDRVSRRLRLVFHADGILSQFEGYEALQEFDWDGYRKRYGHLYRLDFILEAEGDTTNRYKLSKQPDLLMLYYLFSAEELEALLRRPPGRPPDPRLADRVHEDPDLAGDMPAAAGIPGGPRPGHGRLRTGRPGQRVADGKSDVTFVAASSAVQSISPSTV
jgi:hypothetical protein